MSTAVEAPATIVYFATTFLAIIALMFLYSFGVWLRTYVFPTGKEGPVKRQLLASIPIGLITMAGYAKTTFPSINVASTTAAFDVFLIAGYAIIFGMLSRDVLERVLAGGAPTPALPNIPAP